MLTDEQRRFLATQPVAHLATADRRAVPHVVPVCFAVHELGLYVAIDQKPKRGPADGLKRLRNITENPAVSVVVDRYDADWTKLGWVLMHGTAEILRSGRERDDAHTLLRIRYPHYVGMDFTGLPVIAVRLSRANSWGNLTPPAKA